MGQEEGFEKHFRITDYFDGFECLNNLDYLCEFLYNGEQNPVMFLLADFFSLEKTSELIGKIRPGMLQQDMGQREFRRRVDEGDGLRLERIQRRSGSFCF